MGGTHVRLGMALWLAVPPLLSACSFDPSTPGNGAAIDDGGVVDAGAVDDGAVAADAGTPDALPAACLADQGFVSRTGSDHTYRYEGSGRFYDEAQAACAEEGAHLVVIDDQAENDFVTGLGGAPWIGINDYDVEGNFAWVTGAALSYENWAGGEPNDSGGDEDCALLQGTWNDGECSNIREFVCECDPARNLPPPPACMTSAAYSQIFQGRRYRAEATTANYAQARAECASEGGHLVVITDDAENTNVRDMLSGDKWIGYSDTAIEGSFAWVTGSASTFTQWANNQPDDSNGEDCVESNNNGDWNDRPCLDQRAYVCECDPIGGAR